MTAVYKPSVTELASRYKARGYDRYYAWDRYVADTGLQPTVDAKMFYQIYDVVEPELRSAILPQGWTATHIDTLVNREVQIKHENGLYSMVWDNGAVGSDPEALHPDDRYIEVQP